MRTKAVLLVVVALSLALSIAYALWQEKATVVANAQTGYIDLDFKGGSVEKKSRGVEVKWTLKGSEDGNDGGPELYLEVSNLYPNAEVTFKIELKNDGTLPVDVKNCNFTSIEGAFQPPQTGGAGKGQGKGGGGGKNPDVDFVKYEIKIDVDMFKITSGQGQPPPPFGLDPGKSAVVWIYIRALSGTPESASVKATFKCDYILKVK